MLPSTEFSIGTTPRSTAPASVRLNTSWMLTVGRVFTSLPNCLKIASSL